MYPQPSDGVEPGTENGVEAGTDDGGKEDNLICSRQAVTGKGRKKVVRVVEYKCICT